MELANIEKLLNKYFEGNTSVKEEEILKKYFSSKQIAPHLEEYQPLFNYFTISKREALSKPIQLKSHRRNWNWIGIAASLLLLFSVYTGYEYNQQQKAEKIYNETQMALSMLSANLNKGKAIAINELQEFELTKNKAFNNLNK